MPLNHYVTLGRSGLRVSPLCLGAMTFGKDWGWGSDIPESCRIMDAVQSDLELSPAYRAAKEELEATERALAAELPHALPAAATG